MVLSNMKGIQMNEDEVIAEAIHNYMNGISDHVIAYSNHHRDFDFPKERRIEDLSFGFVYRNWSISHEADDQWCEMNAAFDEIDEDYKRILGADDLLEIIEEIIGLKDPVCSERYLQITKMKFDEKDFQWFYHTMCTNLDTYIFSLVNYFSRVQIAIIDGLIEKTSRTLAQLYAGMMYAQQTAGTVSQGNVPFETDRQTS